MELHNISIVFNKKRPEGRFLFALMQVFDYL
jgi:hypothetical protein